MHYPDINYASDLGVADPFQAAFLRSYIGSWVELSATFTLEIALFDFVETVAGQAAAIGKVSRIACWDGDYNFVVGTPEPFLFVRIHRTHHVAPDEASRSHFYVALIGNKASALRLRQTLNETYAGSKLAQVTWHFMTDKRQSAMTIILDRPRVVHDSFYPMIAEGVDAFLDAYMAHSASLLFLAGPPGTGKTSLLQHFLARYTLHAAITYDEEMFRKDELFVSFLTNSASEKVFIVEDADSMLATREAGGNTMISRFLNVSDGLIRLGDKKLVFTTNLSDFRNVDPALMRAGRCFRVVRFRALTADEAGRAAADAGVDDPKRSCTLAQLFNQTYEEVEKKVGF